MSSNLALHDYQIVARDFLRGRDRAALFLDMLLGLGKTACTLSALEPRHLPVLVVAPKRVAEEVWDAEQELWRPDLTLAVAMGEPAARAAALASDADIIVLGRDNIKDVGKVKRSQPFRTLVIDELSGFKGRGTRWKTMRQIIAKHAMPHVWGLTGTPAPKDYLDLWPQIALLDNGDRLGKNITTYRSRYFRPGRQLPNGVIVEWLLREEDGAKAKIKARIEDICLAMGTEGRIKLPPTTFNDVVVDLPPAVRKVYRKLESELVVDLKDIFDGKVHTADNAATLTSRLSQVTAGFIFEDAEYEDRGAVDEDGEPILTHVNEGDYTFLHNEKLNAVKEIVESEHTGGVLVFYRFVPEREKLLKELKGARSIDEPGVIKEWNAGKVPVLVAHPASAGHGLNLQHGGHTMVWASPTWDLEHWDQGVKRLARQGQKHPVVIHLLLAKKSIDYLIRKRNMEKSDVQNDLLEHLESPV